MYCYIYGSYVCMFTTILHVNLLFVALVVAGFKAKALVIT